MTDNELSPIVCDMLRVELGEALNRCVIAHNGMRQNGLTHTLAAHRVTTAMQFIGMAMDDIGERREQLMPEGVHYPHCQICGERLSESDECGEFVNAEGVHLIGHSQCGLDNNLDMA